MDVYSSIPSKKISLPGLKVEIKIAMSNTITVLAKIEKNIHSTKCVERLIIN